MTPPTACNASTHRQPLAGLSWLAHPQHSDVIAATTMDARPADLVVLTVHGCADHIVLGVVLNGPSDPR
jgi:hypothetical protein